MGYSQWQEAVKAHNIVSCVGCTSLIADSPRYGRAPAWLAPNLCEICEDDGTALELQESGLAWADLLEAARIKAEGS